MLGGVRAEGPEHPLVVDAPTHLAAVAGGPHVVLDPAVRVGAQGAVLGELHARPGEECGRGTYADRDHDQVGAPAATVPVHAGRTVAVEVQPGHLGPEHQLDTRFDQCGVDALRHLVLEHRHAPAAGQDGHPEASAQRGLGDLDADVARAHDDHVGVVTGRGEAVDPGGPVIEGLDRTDLGVRRPVRTQGPVRHDRRGSGGHDQLVEGDVLPGRGRDGPRAEVGSNHLGAHPQVDSGRAVLLGAAGDQVVTRGDVAGHPVGDATGAVGRVRPPVEHGDRELAPSASGGAQRLVGRRHAGRVGPDDDDAGGWGAHSMPGLPSYPSAAAWCAMTPSCPPAPTSGETPVRTGVVPDSAIRPFRDPMDP